MLGDNGQDIQEGAASHPYRILCHLLPFLLLFSGVLLASHGQMLPGTKAKGMVMPVYVRGHSQAAAVLRIERISAEYQRKGFFRIGLLPQIVAEGVSIELRQSGALTNALWRSSPRLCESSQSAS
jgi:hypothetical protein